MALTQYQCNITLPRDGFIQIKLEGFDWKINSAKEMTASELAAAHVIQKTLECLAGGISIDRYFNPTQHVALNQKLVKCKWMKSGKLVIVDQDAERKFHHAETQEEAICRRRMFTTTQLVYSLLPKNRGKGS